MSHHAYDLDQLAIRLKAKMSAKELSVRAAAAEMRMGAATLSRLLQGSDNTNTPDLANVSKAAEWVGVALSELAFAPAKQRRSTIADVEVHLRALPGLAGPDVDALVAMVKASYEHARKVRAKS